MSDDSLPLAGLPPANRKLLTNAPLELVICEIRYSSRSADMPSDAGKTLFKRLDSAGIAMSKIDPLHQQRVQFSVQAGVPPSSATETVGNGWQLQTTDGHTQITVTSGSIALQTTRYERWSVTMRPKLEILLAAASDILEPVFTTRLGLRYVDRFIDREATSPSAWNGRINRFLLGLVCDAELGPRIKTSQTQVELSLGDSQGALLRHGAFVDAGEGGSVSYLLDFDVFDLEPQDFDAARIVDQVEVLNRTAAALFQMSLEAEYLDSLQSDAADAEPSGGKAS